MKNKKILIGLMLGLVFTVFAAVNCFAEGLIVENPYIKHIEIKMKETDISFNKKGVGFSSKGYVSRFTPEKDINFPTYFKSSTINEMEVSVGFKDPKTGLKQLIDKREFKADTGGTHGKKIYKNKFLVDGQYASVEYALNIEFVEDSIKGKILNTVEVIVLDASIPGVEKVDL